MLPGQLDGGRAAPSGDWLGGTYLGIYNAEQLRGLKGHNKQHSGHMGLTFSK